MLALNGFIFSHRNVFLFIRKSKVFLKEPFPPHWCSLHRAGCLKPTNIHIRSACELLCTHCFCYYVSSSFLQGLCLPFNLYTSTVDTCMSSYASIFLSPGRKGSKQKGQRLEFPWDSAKEFTVGPLQDTFHAAACPAIKGKPRARLSPKGPSRTAIPPFMYSLGKEEQAGRVVSSRPRDRNHTSRKPLLSDSLFHFTLLACFLLMVIWQ